MIYFRTLVSATIFILACSNHQLEKLPVDVLSGMEVYEGDHSDWLGKSHLVVVHFDQHACLSCVNFSLNKILAYYSAFGDRINFVCITRGIDVDYLRKMKRTGITPYALLIGNDALPLPENFHISLYEMNQLTLVERLFIKPNAEYKLEGFERVLSHIHKEIIRGENH